MALVIEDDPGHQRILELRIKRSGCGCECAFDGRTGLDMALNRRYDILFIDINIPDLDGFMVACQLRESGLAAPLIAVSALKLEGLEKQALAAGYNEFYRKPIEQDMVQGILDKYLFSKKAGSASAS